MNAGLKTNILLAAITMFCGISVNAEVINANKTIDQNGMVNISFNLVAKNRSITTPVFSVKFIGSIDEQDPFVLKSLNGDGSTGIVIGSGRHSTVWNPSGNKIKQEEADKVKIQVEAEDVTEEAIYLVLNLKTFQMSYQKEEPKTKGSKSKTKELWLRRIEPGMFYMGSPTNELGRAFNETLHEVNISRAFYLGVFETTQKQFRTITGYNSSIFKGNTRPVDNVSYNMLRGGEEGETWPQYTDYRIGKSYHDYEKEQDADSFFYSLRQKTGGDLIFDLPTEAQWEYACRAGETTAINDGNNLTNVFTDGNLSQLSWYDQFHYLWISNYKKWSSVEKKNRPHPVGLKTPNNWGLYDMHGNVEEFCLDWYQENLGTRYITDPAGSYKGSAFLDEQGRGPFRVSKGGSCFTDAKFCRSASRNYNLPQYRASNHGFRIALHQ